MSDAVESGDHIIKQVIVTDFWVSAERVILYMDWMEIILVGSFERITWILSLGHAGVWSYWAYVIEVADNIDNENQ